MESDGVISRRDHRHLATCIDWLVRSDRLVAVLPGIYTEPDRSTDTMTRIAAAAAWRPDAVITAHAAAGLTFWPEVRVQTVSLALRNGGYQQPGFRIERRRVDPDHVRRIGRISVTVPALTAIDLVRETGRPDPLDVVLRTKAADLTTLRAAFAALPHRRGNRLCSILLEDSRDNPWSGAERELHRLMRAAGITGWSANCATVIGGRRRVADIRFDKIKLAIEVDGFEVHTRRAVFEDDRARQNDFVLDGWTVLRFTALQIATRPDWVVGQIIEAVASLENTRSSGRHRTA